MEAPHHDVPHSSLKIEAVGSPKADPLMFNLRAKPLEFRSSTVPIR